MIKLTYGQANALTSPIIQQLFQNPTKAFPFVDAFRLTNMVSQLDGKLMVYKDQIRKLAESLGGVITPDGRISFDNPNAQAKFNEQAEVINAETFSIDGDPVVPAGDWPNLSLAEVAILNPLLDKGSLRSAKKEAAQIQMIKPQG